MLTVNVKTKAVTNAHEHAPIYNSFGNCVPGYVRGWIAPRYPVPMTRHALNIPSVWEHLVIHVTRRDGRWDNDDWQAQMTELREHGMPDN